MNGNQRSKLWRAITAWTAIPEDQHGDAAAKAANAIDDAVDEIVAAATREAEAKAKEREDAARREEREAARAVVQRLYRALGGVLDVIKSDDPLVPTLNAAHLAGYDYLDGRAFPDAATEAEGGE